MLLDLENFTGHCLIIHKSCSSHAYRTFAYKTRFRVLVGMSCFGPETRVRNTHQNFDPSLQAKITMHCFPLLNYDVITESWRLSDVYKHICSEKYHMISNKYVLHFQ